MKKITYLFFMLAGIAGFLASCSSLSTVSVTKRHYNGGYFVQINNNKHKTEAIADKIKIAEDQPVQIVQPAVANNEHQIVSTEENLRTNILSETPKTKRDVSKAISASVISHSAPGNLKNTMKPNTMKELQQINTTSKYLISESKGHNNGNNGLIWTIIVILLLLWLLSLLTGGWGLGGLIYILLVLAIILLILKLLGII
jgi:Family of unknown function (DUF5670)